MQGTRDKPLSSLHGSRTSVDKGKRKMSDFANEVTFCSVRPGSLTFSEVVEAQLQCNLHFLLMFWFVF